MPIPSKADCNVPLRPGKAWYSIVGIQPTWVFHIMADGVALTGEAPLTSAVPKPEDLEPMVSAGRADYGFPDDKLTKGGLFTHIGRVSQPVIVEAASLPGDPVVTVVNSEGTLLRTLASGAPLSGFPIRLGAGEYLKVVGGTAGGDFGFLVRLGSGVQIL